MGRKGLVVKHDLSLICNVCETQFLCGVLEYAISGAFALLARIFPVNAPQRSRKQETEQRPRSRCRREHVPGAVAAGSMIAHISRVQAAIGTEKTAVALNATLEKERSHLSATHRKLKNAGGIDGATKGATSQKACAYYKISLEVSTTLLDRIKRHS